MLAGAFLYAYFAGELVRTGVTPSFIVQLIVASLLFYILYKFVRKVAVKKGISIEALSEEDE